MRIVYTSRGAFLLLSYKNSFLPISKRFCHDNLTNYGYGRIVASLHRPKLMSPDALKTSDHRQHPEDSTLKIGYAAMLHRCWPLTNNPDECFTFERAFFMESEREFMEIPEELRFENLSGSIPDVHRERLAGLWNKVLQIQAQWQNAIRKLLDDWSRAPKTTDLSAKDALEQTAIDVQSKFQRATAAVISDPAKIQKNLAERVQQFLRREERPPTNWWEKPLTDFERWKITEADSRESLYKKDKDYFAALRLYYELLLEKPRDSAELKMQKATREEIAAAKARPPILPLDHPLRGEILTRLRMLYALDSLRQGISYAKGAHHEQKQKRVRDAEGVPYIFHPAEAAGSLYYDVVPFLVANDDIPKHLSMPVELEMLAALHDLAEDTELSSEYVIHNFVKPRANRPDTSINQLIISGFDIPSEKFRKRYELLKGRQLTNLTKALAALSKNEPMSERQFQSAIQQNIFGAERTMSILQPTADSAAAGTDKSREPNKTMKRFPIPPQEEIAENLGSNKDFFKKIDRLIIYSASFLEQKREHPIYYMTMLVKMADTSHNIATQRNLGLVRRCKKLFPTTLRLLPWLLFEHDHQRFPLYNALPRLYEETMKEYEALLNDLPEYEIDELQKAKSPDEGRKIVQRYKWIHSEAETHLALLKSWGHRPELQRKELPERFQKIDARAKKAA